MPMGETEIQQFRHVLDAAEIAQDDVAGLDVAMHKSAPMSFLKSPTNLPEDVNDAWDGERPLAPDELVQIRPR